jgi:glutamate decarboxylase
VHRNYVGLSPATSEVTWTLSPDLAHTHNLFDLAEELRTRGWLVPAYTLPPDQPETIVQRIIVRHGLSIDMADLLLKDMRMAIMKLDDRPPSRPLAPAEGASFHHDADPMVPDALITR